VRDEFTGLRQTGHSDPLMDEIETLFGGGNSGAATPDASPQPPK
jgi:hypothetical protein